ncbi:MAG: glycosyltransferase [Bacteroidales bacterium]|nr:glycosyltransferase [Bacteroidales bacterium]
MLVGYEANNALRNSHELGEFARNLIERLATGRVNSYRALLFATRIKKEYCSYFSGYSNVGTFVPFGLSRLLPELWMRYRLNPWLRLEKVKIFHGLNEELPYHIDRNIKTIITCYGVDEHHRTSLMDSIVWKKRMEYAYEAANVIVAVSNEVRQQLINAGVSPEKIVVIGGKTPYELTDRMVEQYFELYRTLAGE